ncbi:MAG: zf-HC2 domain-containing protein [Myxococcota bacterium]
MIASHLTDEKTAQLLDRALPELEAQQARAHVAQCPDCQERVHAVEALMLQLRAEPASDEQLVRGVMARISDENSASSRRGMWSALAAGVSVATVALVMVRSPADDVGMTARGGPVAVAPVHLKAFQARGAGMERLAEGDRTGLPLKLSVTLDVLPAQGATHAAVYARDAAGRVTWLLPSWTDAATSPGCVALPAGGGAVTSSHAVELPDPPTGTVEIVAVAATEACSIPALDERLESTGDITQGGLRVAERLRVVLDR